MRLRLQPYLPRVTLDWLAHEPNRLHQRVDGSMVFVDISGFTALSEKLARLGRMGAEEMAEAINSCFSELLVLAYEEDGSLVKFGGDALLLLFTSETPGQHAIRAARAAAGMRKRLREVGHISTPGGRVKLRMSVGMHTGAFDLFLVGGSHRELLVTGPAATEVVTMEGTAEAGEIVMSPITASLLPRASRGEAKASGVLLRSAPAGELPAGASVVPDVSDELLTASVPLAIRDSLLAGVVEPEHRQVSIGFIHFDGTDALIERKGPQIVADELDRLVRDVQDSADHFGVCFLASDVDADGGKLILTAGAPRSLGDDEERMLLALRRIIELPRSIPVRIGVNQGAVFAGDIGPKYRRTYTVMGDAVNLTARLMAKADEGCIYASGSVLERSATRFETVELAPFLVKGKAEPVQAWSLGPPIGRPKHTAAEDHPLCGRDAERERLRQALSAARDGRPATIVLQGEAGIGKTRLLDDVLMGSGQFQVASATSEAFTSATPYIAWREILRDLTGLGWEEASEVVGAEFRRLLEQHDPSLLPWLPLIASAADAVVEPTPEVETLDAEFRRPKLHEAVVGFLRAIRTDPTIFVFEDAHLMDEASAELLAAMVADERGDRPWLVLVLRRPGTGGFRPPDEGGVEIVELGPIDTFAARQLAESATEDAPLSEHIMAQVVERSQGNPELLLDLIHAARLGHDELPESVEAAATVRIDALTPHDRQLVRRLSVLGQLFHPRFVLEVLDDDATRPDDSTWTRLAEFFEPADSGFLRFRRAVIRDAAYAGLPFRLRRRLHRRVAERWERDVADPEENGGLLSLHFSLGGEYEKTWRYARIAATRAAAMYANIEAAELFDRAIDAGRRLSGVTVSDLCSSYEAMGTSLLSAGEFRAATVALSASLRLAKGDSLREARILLERARMEDRLGRYRLSLRWATRAIRALEGVPGRAAASQRARVMAWYAEVLQSEGRTKDAMAWCARAMDEAKRSRDPLPQARIHWVLGWADIVQGRPSGDHLQAALRIYEDLGDIKGQAQMLQNLGAAAFLESRWHEAVELWERGRELFLRLGDPVSAAISEGNISEVLLEQGRLEEAEANIKDAIRIFRAAGDRYAVGTSMAHYGRVLARLGRFANALEVLRAAKTELEHLGGYGDVIDVEARIAECHVLMAEPRSALDMADQVLQRLANAEGGEMSGPLVRRVRGYALTQLGLFDPALEAFEASADEAEGRGAAHEVALAGEAIVRLNRLRGREIATAFLEENGKILADLDIIAVVAPPLVVG